MTSTTKSAHTPGRDKTAKSRRHLKVVPRLDGKWSVAKFDGKEMVGSKSVHDTEAEARAAISRAEGQPDGK